MFGLVCDQASGHGRAKCSVWSVIRLADMVGPNVRSGL